MKLNVIFGKDSVDWFSTNTQITQSIQREIENSNNRIISYTLNDLPLTRKFIDYWQIYRKYNLNELKSTQVKYNFNYYPIHSKEMVDFAKKEMNLTINKLKFLGYDIDDKLYLKDNLSQENFIKNLNELHFIFETESIKLKNVNSPKFENNELLWHSLEKINNLVHFLELCDLKISNNFSSFCVSIRPTMPINSQEYMYYILQDNDYKDFVKIDGGDLVCDFATVGKDLWYCSLSNDIELVQKKEIKQQSQLTDFIFLNFGPIGPSNKKKDFSKHYEWCKKNNVDRYVDYNIPKYSPGRHVLGKIDEPIYTGYDFYNNVVSKNPRFLGYYLSYDNGELLISENL